MSTNAEALMVYQSRIDRAECRPSEGGHPQECRSQRQYVQSLELQPGDQSHDLEVLVDRNQSIDQFRRDPTNIYIDHWWPRAVPNPATCLIVHGLARCMVAWTPRVNGY